MNILSFKEEEVMLQVWELQVCSIKDIQLSLASDIIYRTLASVFVNLENKGFVNKSYKGNAKIYTPIISQEEYKHFRLSIFVDACFDSSYKEMVLSLYNSGDIELKDIIQIRDNYSK